MQFVGGQLCYCVVFDWLQCLQFGDDFIQWYVQCMGGSGGSQGIGDIVLFQQVELDLCFICYVLQFEVYVVVCIVLQIGGVEIGLGLVEGESQ